ncbi:hypothetical protein OH77DRAFT_1425888 [Trametes cingulata]|nr:hypothetical protein OH77DRAFT_1425888 [Trametes cingulata]
MHGAGRMRGIAALPSAAKLAGSAKAQARLQNTLGRLLNVRGTCMMQSLSPSATYLEVQPHVREAMTNEPPCLVQGGTPKPEPSTIVKPCLRAPQNTPAPVLHLSQPSSLGTKLSKCDGIASV